MMRWAALLFLPPAAHAESLVATQVIAAKAILAAEDVAVVAAEIPGAVSDPVDAVGQQALRAIQPGRPILARDIAPPIIVARNARVVMRYQVGGLEITSEGRALDKGAVGQSVRVMSLSSKSIVSARIAADGSVLVEAE
jgi:flagella basal body P-ring formation protein FlgA